jgi:mannose-6-phosphate isomerase-like protein (cupin superfamily)
MKNYIGNIESETLKNNNFRKVLFTGENEQLVVMSLKPGENIGMEVHPDVDQFIRIEEGEAQAILDGEEHELEDDWAIIISAGTEHDVINTSETEDLKLYTIYSPPEHPDGTIHVDKAEAEEYEKNHH